VSADARADRHRRSGCILESFPELLAWRSVSHRGAKSV
jgi:hypothetical protein